MKSRSYIAGMLVTGMLLFIQCGFLLKKPVQDVPFDVLLNDGITYFYLNEYDAALETWKMCLAKEPNNAKIHNFIGVVYYKKADYANAVEHFTKSIELDESSPETYNNLGYALFLLGRYEEAEKYFQKALSIDPYFTQASSNLKTVKRIISGSLDIRAYKLFQKSAQVENLDQNIKYYTEALEIDPDYAEAHNNLGVVRYHNGEFDAALKEFQTAIQLDPDYPEAYNNQGYLFDEQGRYEEAVNAYLKAISFKQDYLDAYNNLGSSYFNMGNYDDAERVWKKILEMFPYNDEAKFHLRRLDELRKLEIEGGLLDELDELDSIEEIGEDPAPE